MPLIIDFSQIVVGNVCAIQKSSTTRQEFNIDLVRHVTLMGIKNLRQIHQEESHDTIIAVDSKNLWRKEIYPYYKAKRQAQRDSMEGVDWDVLYVYMDQLKQELIAYFPYRVVEVQKCEADDVIAVLALEFAKQKQTTVIVSKDEDFLQLQRFNTIFQWHQTKKEFMRCKGSSETFLKEKIIKGDVGDGIPNIMSDDDTFVNPDKRQKTMTKGRLEAFMTNDPSSYDDVAKEGYERNRKLIDLIECIPDTYRNQILDAYTNSATPKGLVFDYLVRNRLKKLTQDASGLI